MQLLFPVLSHYAQKFLFPSDDKIPMHGSPASHYDNGSGWLIPDLLLEVFAACAEFEMEKREKRQREGYEALKARGEWDKLGRPVKMTQEEFLNKWDQKGKNVTDKEFAESLNISKGTLQSYKKKYLKGNYMKI